MCGNVFFILFFYVRENSIQISSLSYSLSLFRDIWKCMHNVSLHMMSWERLYSSHICIRSQKMSKWEGFYDGKLPWCTDEWHCSRARSELLIRLHPNVPWHLSKYIKIYIRACSADPRGSLLKSIHDDILLYIKNTISKPKNKHCVGM